MPLTGMARSPDSQGSINGVIKAVVGLYKEQESGKSSAAEFYWSNIRNMITPRIEEDGKRQM